VERIDLLTCLKTPHITFKNMPIHIRETEKVEIYSGYQSSG